MSGPALKWMLMKRLPAPQKSTGITLARRQPDDLRPFSAPAATLAAESGLSLSGFKLAVSGLEAKGLLAIIPKSNRPNLYDLNLSCANHDVSTHDVTSHEVTSRYSRGDWPATHEVTTKIQRDKQLKTNTSSSSRSKQADSRFQEFLSELKGYWTAANQGIAFAFDSRDGAQLKALLAKHTSLDAEFFRKCLQHRLESDAVVHTKSPHLWLSRILEYADSPLDQFQKPKGANNAAASGSNTQFGASQYATNRAQERTNGLIAGAAGAFEVLTGGTGSSR